MIATNLKIKDGVLEFAGFSTPALARKYGTPLYLMDEQRIRDNCRMYQSAMTEFFGPNALTLYASKALSFKRMYEIVADEGLGIDVVSSGEVHTAAKAGFPMDKVYFHGNNKSPEEIDLAMDSGVGYFVVDNRDELERVSAAATPTVCPTASNLTRLYSPIWRRPRRNTPTNSARCMTAHCN